MSPVQVLPNGRFRTGALVKLAEDTVNVCKFRCARYRVWSRMSMIVEIASDLEPILKAEAGKAGIDPVAYMEHLLRKALPAGAPAVGESVSAQETSLLKRINQGFSPDQMVRYRELVRKRQEEAISPEEWHELENCTARLEHFQTDRMQSLSKLAQLRNVSVRDLMAQLEIRAPDVL